MIRIEYNGQSFSGPSEWSEVTLRQFIDLAKLRFPEKLLRLINSASKEEEYSQAFNDVSHEDNVKVFPAFFGEVIRILTDIPQDVLDQIGWSERTELYFTAFHQFMLSTITDIPMMRDDEGKIVEYVPEKMESFEWKGQRYCFPISLRISDMELPLAEEPVITFLESSEILSTWHKISERNPEHIAMVAGIYLRKKGELYNEKTAIQRSKEFVELPMNIVWSLFFCTRKLAVNLLQNIPSYFSQIAQAKNRRLRISRVSTTSVPLHSSTRLQRMRSLARYQK